MSREPFFSLILVNKVSFDYTITYSLALQKVVPEQFYKTNADLSLAKLKLSDCHSVTYL